MAKNKFTAPTFDEIVFEFRNKEYGAYVIRKKYNKYMTIALSIGILVVCTALITPYLSAKKAFERGEAREERQVEIVMEDLEIPDSDFAPPPPPPPPPPSEAVVQQAYVPPVVVDSVKPEEEMSFMIATDIAATVVDRAVDEVVVAVAVDTGPQVIEEVVQEAFIVVEEMPMYPGGDVALMTFLQNAVVYPERAKENNIQGRVFLQFVVTPQGTVGEVRVLRGVDPLLDEAAMAAVRQLSGFRPGRQGGVAVPVWYQVPITFQLR
jgi:protein TonB